MKMKAVNMRRIMMVFLVCLAVSSSICMPSYAVTSPELHSGTFITRATGRFNMDVPAKTLVTASSSFPMEVGETITINASYSPASASMDFGFIAPDGLFYSVNVTGGSINRGIDVSQRGNYTFAVRNNSSNTVSVSGFVNY